MSADASYGSGLCVRYACSKKGGIGASWQQKVRLEQQIGYFFTVFVAVCVDYFLYKFAQELGLKYESQTYFALLVAIWFVINEAISVLENAGRMGVELPQFLKKTLSELKKDLDDDKKGKE